MNIPDIYAPNAIAPAYDMLKDYLEKMTGEVEAFSDGELIQVSWMFLKVREMNGKLKIMAPQFEVMPINFVDDCSNALNLVATQRYLLDSFNAEYGWCNFRQTALTVKNLEECSQIFMNRIGLEKEDDSGWFFGAEDSGLDGNDVENIELKSLWELFCLYPQSGDFFLLPPGWQVVFSDYPVVYQDFKEAKYSQNSFYEKKYVR